MKYTFVDTQLDSFQVAIDQELQAAGLVRELNPRNCDIIISSERQPAQLSVVRLQMQNDNPGQIYIRTCTEAVEADLNIYDYSLGLLSGDPERVIQVPAVDAFSSFCPRLHELSFSERPVTRIPQKGLLYEPRIDFIYSNPGGSYRKNIFDAFNQKYKVNSYGNFLNNQDNRTRNDWSSSWREDKIFFHKENHFSLALENTVASGYITEKILTPLEAGTVPIYFGHVTVTDQINPRTFRGISDVSRKGINEVIEWISSLSELDFQTMLSEPVFSEDQLKFHSELRKSRKLIFERLAAGNSEALRPIGYAKNLHLRRTFRELEITHAATFFLGVWRKPVQMMKSRGS